MKRIKNKLLVLGLCIGILAGSTNVMAAEIPGPWPETEETQTETAEIQTETAETQTEAVETQTETVETQTEAVGIQTVNIRPEQILQDVRMAPAAEGKWKKKKGVFRKKDGTYAKSEWLRINNKIYCFDKQGYLRKGWYRYQGSRYYFATNGAMVTGWHKIGKSTYYFQKDGKMLANKWKKRKGKYYYLKNKGRMATGWLTLGTRKYYLDKTGARVSGEYRIKGKIYHFGANGVYQQEIETPQMPVTPQIPVTYTDVDPNRPMLALTFDDGPGPYTERLLNCLEKNHAVATFFVVGSNVGYYESTVRRASNMGCEIGNHSWDHPQLTTLGADGIASQISTTNQAVQKATGKGTTLLRPPYGSFNSTVSSLAGTPLILWDVDTLDWKTRNSQSTIDSVLGSAKDGSIVLMHDIHLPTVVAVESLIPLLKEKGYQLVTVSDLAKYKHKPLTNGVGYYFIR